MEPAGGHDAVPAAVVQTRFAFWLFQSRLHLSGTHYRAADRRFVGDLRAEEHLCPTGNDPQLFWSDALLPGVRTVSQLHADEGRERQGDGARQRRRVRSGNYHPQRRMERTAGRPGDLAFIPDPRDPRARRTTTAPRNGT